MHYLQFLLTLAFLSAPLRAAIIGQGILAVHGGYAPDKPELTEALTKELCSGMKEALSKGYATLKEKKSGLDAVESAIRILEDNPNFNAGRGAVFTHEGKNELDASIMEGKEKKAGAVASVTNVKNPITGARAVMEKTRHVLLVGPGAEKFAKQAGVETVEQKYFWTKPRWDEHLRDLEKEKKQKTAALPPGHRWGTVGAVALDLVGTLNAGTSTGGLSNKMHGRVGDSPIIGAGTYADNEGVAVSATGHGEYFIRFHAASEINDLVKYKGMPLKDATFHVLNNELSEKAGEGGVIAIDKHGNVSLDSNTSGMIRGFATKDGVLRAFVGEEECKL